MESGQGVLHPLDVRKIPKLWRNSSWQMIELENPTNDKPGKGGKEKHHRYFTRIPIENPLEFHEKK